MIFDSLAPFVRRLLLTLCLALLAAPATAQVAGISYTFSPTAERVFFTGDAGLAEGYLYGGKLGFGFGEYVELSGVYQLSSNLETEFSGLSDLSETQQQRFENLLLPRQVDLQRYGGELKFNLSTGSTIPYVTLGTGILHFDPERIGETRTVYLAAGGGVQLSQSGRYSINVGLENLSYRYDLVSTLLSPQDRADVGLASYERYVNNWAVRAGVQVYLGGRSRGELTELDLALRNQLSGGLSGIGLIIEPFYGRIGFDKVFNLREDQRMTGLFAGINMGPYVGLRGFYWRGLQEDELSFGRLQAYGGEMKLAFGSEVQGITPYVTIGAGYLDPLSGYQGPTGAPPPEEHPFATGGGGLVVPVGSSFRLHGEARSLLMSDENADELETQSDVHANWMYSLGVTFTFGRRSETAGRVVETRFEATRAGIEEVRTREERLAAQLERSEERLDALDAALRRAQQGDTEALAEALVQMRLGGELRRQGQAGTPLAPPEERAAGAPAQGSTRDQRTVTLPVLENGEVYVRFGEGGGVSPFARDTTAHPAPRQTGQLTSAQIERIVRETVQSQLQDLSRQQLADTQQRQLTERLENRIRSLEQRIETLRDQRAGRGVGAVEDDEVAEELGEAAHLSPIQQRLAGLPAGSVLLAGVLPFSALTFGDPTQFALGARADLRSNSFTPVRIAPEFSLGLGLGNYSYHLNANALYPIPAQLPFFDDVFPYVGGGLGFLGFDSPPADVPGVQLTINLLLGGEIVTENGVFFAEYGNFDFFDYNRIAVGYRYGF